MWKSRCLEKRGKTVTTFPNNSTGITFNESRTQNRNKLRSDQVRRHSSLKKCYNPLDFAENNEYMDFNDKIVEPVDLLRSEINEWKKQELISSQMEERIAKLSVAEPESDNSQDSPGEPHPVTEESSIASLIELPIEQQQIGTRMEKNVLSADGNVGNVDDAGIKEQMMSQDTSTSSLFDGNILESLQMAEKLVQKAERTIVEARWNVCLSETSLENTQVIDLDDETMEIRSIVAAKFDEANGRRVKAKKVTISHKSPPRIRANADQGQCINPKIREPRKLKQDSPRKTRKPLKKAENSLSNIKIQKGPKINIRNQMSLSKIEAIEILPSAITERNTGKLYQLRHEACKRGWINDRDSLIDACVQTSLRDSPPPIDTFKFAEPVQDALSRSHGSDLDQNKIHQLNLSRGKEMRNSCCNTENDEKFKSKKKKDNPKTFMDFLCQMEIKDENNRENYDYDDYNSQLSSSLSTEGISLISPDVGNLNEILNNIDEKLKVISNVTANLCDFAKPEKVDSNRNNNEENQVKVLLKPRSRVSSSSSAVSSEIFHPPERFSTPLNNLNIDASFNVKLQINEQRVKAIIPVSDLILLDAKNVIEDTRVAITRNRFSSSSFNNDRNETETRINELASVLSAESGKKESASEDKTGDKTGSSFPSYSAEKSSNTRDICSNNELKLKSSQEEKDIVTQSINFQMQIVKSQEFQGNLEKADNSVTSNKDNVGNSENSVISGSNKNKDNSENLSSGRDRTSNDISGLSSRILETLSNEKIEASLISPENKEESEKKLLFPRDEIVEEKNDTSTNNGSKKTISMTSSSSSTNSKRSNGKRFATDYSEGELFLPSSCTHSLGEIVPSNLNVPDNFNRIFVNLSNQASSQIAKIITDESSGEVLITDIESNSSFG